VNGIVNHVIWYSRNTNLNVAGYSDADWVGCANDRKSTSAGCSYVGTNLVAWLRKKQNSIYLSPLQRPSTLLLEVAAHSSCG
jgi:hypothetical protein